MKKIENGIQEIHAESTPMEQEPASVPRTVQFTEKPTTAPIAKVNLVSQGSPAEFCVNFSSFFWNSIKTFIFQGIRFGDEIISVGSVSAENFKDLTQIGEVIRHRKDQSIEVVVIRESKIIRLDLVPKIWSGRGLLGCNIVVMETEIER